MAPAAFVRRDHVVEDRGAGLERAREALLLAGQDLGHLVAVLCEVGVRLAELVDDHAVQLRQERRRQPDAVAVRDGAADDAAQDVAALLVGRDDAVGGQERHAAAVVGEHAQRAHRGAAVGVLRARPRLAGRDDLLEAVGLVDGVHALQQRRDALHAGAGVDRRLRQRREAVRLAVELHEDEVPVLEHAVAVALRAALVGAAAERPAAAVLGAAVVEQLRAGAARTGRPGLPEVVLAERDDALLRLADGAPQVDRLVVARHAVAALVDGHPEPLADPSSSPRATAPRPARWRAP